MKANPESAKAGRRAKNAGPEDLQSSLEQASGDLLRKVPPHSKEAEQAVLGGVFIRNDVLHSIIDMLQIEDFYYPAHQTLYNTFQELFRAHTPVDLVTVAEHLQAKAKLEEVGGAQYLADLAESSVVSAANAVHHAKIVRDKSVQRRLIKTASEIVAASFGPAANVDELLEEAESTIFAISERSHSSTYASSKTLVEKVFDDLSKRVERRELVTGVPTGYAKLNEITAGFQPSDLIIIAGRPSMGKTAFALNVALKAAVNYGAPVAIFSLEMSMDQLMQRMLCVKGKVDLGRLRRGYLDDRDWQGLYDAANAMSQAPIYIDDKPALSTLELRARCRRLKAEKDIQMVLVDYLQLMRAGVRTDSREQEISDISRSLKALAKELNVPVLALSQLNRKVEERTDKRPMLSDLRESGAIEQDADVIIFLYRADAYRKGEDVPKTNIAEIIVGKQRNGPTGKVDLTYLDYCTGFEDLDRVHSVGSEEPQPGP